MSTKPVETTDESRTNLNKIKIEQQCSYHDSDNECSPIQVINEENLLFKFDAFLKKYIENITLVFQSIIPDLRTFKHWQIVLLLLYAAFNVTFSIVDLNSTIFGKKKSSFFKWINEANNGVPLWRRILLCLSGVSAFTNVLNVVLVIHGKMSSYFWGITGAILYGSYAFGYGYVGDAQLFVFFFLPTQFVGIYLWSKELDKTSTTHVKRLTIYGWVLILFSCITLTIIFYFEIPSFSKYLTSTYIFEKRLIPHLLDAITNGCSVIAQLLLIACYLEQYIIWVFVNIMLIVMYSGFFGTNLDINLLFVWIMLTVNSSCGYYTWYHRWRKSHNSSPILNIKI